MKRILVIGSCGSGKSTFARKLGERTGLDVIHLDRVYWKPNWEDTPKDEWPSTVAGLLEGESWIIDGNYSGTLEMRLQACDMVIFLDLPRWLCTYRIVKRYITYRKVGRPDMAEGCDEKLDLDFVKWVWNYPKRSKPKVERMLAAVEGSKNVIRLRSTANAEKFLAEFPQS